MKNQSKSNLFESNLNIVKEVIDAMNECKSLVYLNLEGNTLGVEAARAIGEALKKHPEFQKALFKDLFTGRMKTEIPPALQSMGAGMIAAGAQLTVFDCSDNALGPNGMTGLVDLFRSPTCYSLQVCDLEIVDVCFDSAFQILKRLFSRS